MKAYLNVALQIGGKRYEPSSDDKPSIVELADAEFKRLAEMNYVRQPTDVEEKLFSLLTPEDAVVVSETPAPKKKAAAAAAAPTEASAPTEPTTPSAPVEDEV